jgi:hypothetical protein
LAHTPPRQQVQARFVLPSHANLPPLSAADEQARARRFARQSSASILAIGCHVLVLALALLL